MHINTVLLIALVVYTVRDVYPLVTYSKHPIDLDLSHKASGRLLWTKIILLVLTAVLIPLTSPNVWIPVDTEIQTARLLWFFRFFTNAHVDCHRVGHLLTTDS